MHLPCPELSLKLGFTPIAFVDIHEGIDSTLMILQNRFQERAGYRSITVIKK